VATQNELLQADKYRKYVLKRFAELSDPNAIKYSHVQSHLIAAELHEDAASVSTAFADHGWVLFTTWDDLITRAKYTHTQFREIFAKQAQEAADDAGPKLDEDDED
jgi:hypothetical protein